MRPVLTGGAACGQCAGSFTGRWADDLTSGSPSVFKRRMPPARAARACRRRVRRACAGAGAPVALNEVRKRLKRVDRGSAQGVHRTDRGCPLGLPGDAPGWPPVAGMPPVAEAGRGRGRGAAHHARGAARHAGTSRPVAQGTFTARAPSRPRDLHGQGEKTLEPDPVVRPGIDEHWRGRSGGAADPAAAARPIRRQRRGRSGGAASRRPGPAHSLISLR